VATSGTLAGTEGSDAAAIAGSVADASSAPDRTFNFSTGSFPGDVTFSRVTIGTYTNSSGVLTTAAIDAPRLDYDPVTLAARGLLIEAAATNLIRYSEDQSNGAWAFVGGSRTGTTTLGPDGVTAITPFTEDTSASAHAFYGTAFSLSASTVYCVSGFVKGGTRQYVSIRGETTGAGPIESWITLDTASGAVAANGAVLSSGAIQYPNGWWRAWFTFTNSSAIVNSGNIVVAGSNVSAAPATSSVLGNSYTGASATFYAVGLSIEQGALSSYIPTGTAPVTRAADAASVTGTNFSSFWNPAEGAIVVTHRGTPGSDYAKILHATEDLQANAVVQMYFRNGGQTTIRADLFNTSSVPTTVDATATRTVGTARKVGLSYKNGVANNALIDTNESTIVAGTYAGSLRTATRMQIGSDSDGTQHLGSHIAKIEYYNSFKDSAALEALTA
jgi:hypothetical protein